jgi:hypothetical protein
VARRKDSTVAAVMAGMVPGHLLEVDSFRSWWQASRGARPWSLEVWARLLAQHRATFAREHPKTRVPRDWPAPDASAAWSASARARWRESFPAA